MDELAMKQEMDKWEKNFRQFFCDRMMKISDGEYAQAAFPRHLVDREQAPQGIFERYPNIPDHLKLTEKGLAFAAVVQRYGDNSLK